MAASHSSPAVPYTRLPEDQDAGAAEPLRVMSRARHGCDGMMGGRPAAALLVLYMLGAATETLPLTAYTGWVNEDLKMPQAQQSNFYAVIFFPWLLKPLYGFLTDRVPLFGRHRRPYLVLCSLGATFAYLATAFLVTSVRGAFAITTLRTFSNAFAELVLGTVMLDGLEGRRDRAGAVQAWVTGARYAGTLAAYLLSLVFYNCNTDGTQHRLTNRHVIAINAVLPVLSLLVTVLWLPETRVAQPQARRQAALTPVSVQGVGATVMLQLIFLWVGLRSLFSTSLWIAVLATLLAMLLFFAFFLAVLHRAYMDQGARSAGDDEGALPSARPPTVGVYKDLLRRHKALILAATFLFLFDAVPSADVQVSNYEYFAFADHLCRLQHLGLISSAASLAASIMYGALFDRRTLSRTLILTAILAGVTSLTCLPFVRMADPAGNQQRAFLLDSVSTVVSAFFGQLAFIPALVLATQQTPRNNAGTVYAIFLSFMDFGDTLSGIITAPIVSALGITSTDWSGLQALVLIGAASQVGTLLLVPLLQISALKPPSEDDDEDKAVQTQPLLLQAVESGTS